MFLLQTFDLIVTCVLDCLLGACGVLADCQSEGLDVCSRLTCVTMRSPSSEAGPAQRSLKMHPQTNSCGTGAVKVIEAVRWSRPCGRTHPKLRRVLYARATRSDGPKFGTNPRPAGAKVHPRAFPIGQLSLLSGLPCPNWSFLLRRCEKYRRRAVWISTTIISMC